MADDEAGIYWPKKPEAAFYRLPEAKQKRLSAFLDQQLAELQSSGGGSREGCSGEWEPGRVVYWDVNLKPKYRDGSTMRKAPSSSAKLGSFYRIEILLIGRLP